MPDHLHDRVVAAIGDKYLIEDEVGRGGHAVVYRGTDLRLNRTVAIKVLPPELAFNADVRTRFIREAQTAAQLSHPHIVPIYSVDERDHLVYFVMALVQGRSVGATIAAGPPWSVEDTQRVLREVAEALAYAHGNGVVHRDVKPDNILIDAASGRAVVTDFGIARAAAADSRLTVTGVAVGTPAYMSPEQALGERELDGRSDIYSLAVVGYHMLTGALPFRASSAAGMLVKHVSETPRPVRDRRPDVPAALAYAIDRALAKRPEDRWETALEFRDAVSVAGPARSDRRESALQSPEARPRPPLADRADRRPPLSHARSRTSLDHLHEDDEESVLPRRGLTKHELAEMQRRQRAEERARRSLPQPLDAVDSGWRSRPEDEGQRGYDSRPLVERVIAFRQSVVRFMLGTPAFLAINIATDTDPWFFIPAAVLLFDAVRRGGSIWSDGVGPFEAFGKGIRARLSARRAATASARIDDAGMSGGTHPAERAVPREVLQGEFGPAVRRAFEDRRAIQEIVAAINPIDREMLPDVAPTVDGLAERVAALGTALHRLDTDVSSNSLPSLDRRISELQAQIPTADQERRLALLQRQRASLEDLVQRRQAMAGQLESATIALQTLKLDLMKLRSGGVGAALSDVTSATQEARAVSRDIGRVIEVADDLRGI